MYKNIEDCCGCSACRSVCPKNAITMQADAEGFLYPRIDQNTCVDCGRCAEICPFLREGNYKQTEAPTFFAARHKSSDVLRKSTSGGAFTALSDTVLQQGGVIYGADYDAAFCVGHQRAETSEQRDRMRISKYVQSDMGDTYAHIKADLQQGRVVLFTGTPCQAAGLRGFIGTGAVTKRLYICDLICHSIPSPAIWEAYKALLERESGGSLTSVQFRSKVNGWSRANSNRGFCFKTGNRDDVQMDDRFYHLFFKVGAITRPSCSQCRFTDVHRVSDITIADYWGIERYRSERTDSEGVSLIMVNTGKGAALLTQCSPDLDVEKRPAEEALHEQPRLQRAPSLPENRAQFWTDFQRFGLVYVLKHYF